VEEREANTTIYAGILNKHGAVVEGNNALNRCLVVAQDRIAGEPRRNRRNERFAQQPRKALRIGNPGRQPDDGGHVASDNNSLA
jgi:hypothetical protein